MRNFVPVLSLATGLAVAVLGTSALASPVGPQPYSESLSNLLATYDSNGNLTNDPSFVVSNLVFHEFAYVLPHGGSPTADQVTITRWKDDTLGNLGIRVSGTFYDSPLTAGGTDAILSYVVTSLDGATISDVHLHGEGVSTGFGDIAVDETWADALTGQQLVQGSIHYNNIATGGIDAQLDFGFDFTPDSYSALRVTKDISVNAGPLGSARISIIDQTFSQLPGFPTVGETPEPMTLSLFGLGAVALLFRRPRK